MKLIYEGEDILFTFKQEALNFLNRNNLRANLVENDMTDDDHYEMVGYKSNLYWIAE